MDQAWDHLFCYYLDATMSYCPVFYLWGMVWFDNPAVLRSYSGVNAQGFLLAVLRGTEAVPGIESCLCHAHCSPFASPSSGKHVPRGL